MQYHSIPGALESFNGLYFDETFLACVEAECRILIHFIIMSCGITIDQVDFTGWVSREAAYSGIFDLVVADRQKYHDDTRPDKKFLSPTSYTFLVLRPIVVKPVVVASQMVAVPQPNAAKRTHQQVTEQRIARIKAKQKEKNGTLRQ